jgi:rubrerythrin
MFKKKYIMYCPVCGYVDGEHTKTICPFCNHELKDSDHPLKEMKGKRPWKIDPIAKDIVQRLVKDNPDFEQSIYINRIKEEEERSRIADEAAWAEHQAQVALAKRINAERAANAPRCPTCGSTDLKKIDALDRAISVSFLGLASGKIGKSFKCNHCGYMW